MALESRSGRTAVVVAVALLIGCSLGPAYAADETSQHLERQRSEADARYLAAMAACQAQFAVVDCVERAKAEHRKAIAQLRLERQALDDARRRERAARRARQVEAGIAASDARGPEPPASAAPVPRHAARPASPAASRPSEPTPRSAAQPSEPTRVEPTPAETAQAARERAERAQQRASEAERRRLKAQAHREEVERRNAERDRQRAPATPLPGPQPASAAANR